MKTGRSGEIDVLRFLFALTIMAYHMCSAFKKGYIRHGYIGVEFFFVVTGYLAARHIASRKRKDPDYPANSDIPSETWQFILRKIGQFYRYFICAGLLKFIVFFIIRERHTLAESLREIVHGIPVFTLTFLGLNTDRNVFYTRGMWYVSAMILALIVLYPCMLYRFSFSTRWLFPVISVILLRYMYTTYGTIARYNVGTGFADAGVIRAIAEIAAGASLFALSEWFSGKYRHLLESPSLFTKLCLTLAKLFCFGVVFVYARGTFQGEKIPRSDDIYIFLVCLIGIFLCFSQVGFCIPDGKVTRWLGKASTAVYFFHGVLQGILTSLVPTKGVSPQRFALYIAGIFIMSLALQWGVDLVHKK